LEQIAKLEEALYNIQFEQHWLEAQTDRQAIGIISSLLSNNHLKVYIFLQGNPLYIPIMVLLIIHVKDNHLVYICHLVLD
jgi:hypothetical protein